MKTHAFPCRIAVAAVLFISLAFAPAPCGAAETAGTTGTMAEQRDPKAVEHARKEMAASGGSAWEKARYIRFDFSVETATRHSGPISHAWDRYTGRYRVEVPGEKGYTAYFNAQAPADLGQAVILKAGARVTGPEAEALLKKAYGRFINDTYWLLAPLKVLDPGVNLADEGESDFEGKKARVIRLSFGKVGLTPGDVYKHFLDPETGRMLGWEYKLQDSTDGPTRWRWEGYESFAGLVLSTKKVNAAGDMIRTDHITVSATVDADALKPPGS
ncbi:MAG: hypothetical protein ABIT01_07135 [Thermoanaerobaculia bacterium]